jgi:hypothetical protein
VKNITKLLMIALLSATIFGSLAQAQERTLINVTVPFDFAVGNTGLPAGSYTMSLLFPMNLIRVQSVDGRNIAFFSSIPALSRTDKTQSKAVFHRIGGEYFLSEIWEGGSNTYRRILASKRARELAKNHERKQAEPIVAVAAR